MKINVQPLGDRVLVQPITVEETTKAGIVLPDSVEKEKKAEGEVIAVGAGDKIKALGLKVGDKVLFGKYSGDEIEIDKEELKFLKHDEVLAIIN